MFTVLKETKLLEGEAKAKRDRNREYLMRLKVEDLLLSHYMEAGLLKNVKQPEQIGHWGWDAPTCEIRGIVAGHFLSASARIVSETSDEELLAKANRMVKEIARCQKENGGEWAFPIPEKYMHWIKIGKRVWAPQYVCHKNMMGLLDMYTFTGNEVALEILKKCADWFLRFTNDISREAMNEMMEIEETGGIMEYWADLYSVTKDEHHLELMRRYERPLLFDPIYRGEDVLTNMHANTVIPEIHGAARAFEVTGEERYRKIVENFWSLAVTQRGMFATGGQSSGEIWTPMNEQSSRLGIMNQEHCVVFNMMRLADYLLRWTGDSQYADYWERNLLNGIFAQGYWEGRRLDNLCDAMIPEVTTVAYFLPFKPGSRKMWGSEKRDFWCCHCTLLQANAFVNASVFFRTDDGVAVSQCLNAETNFELEGTKVHLSQTTFAHSGENIRIAPRGTYVINRPSEVHMILKIETDSPTDFVLKLREPEWSVGSAKVMINGRQVEYTKNEGFLSVGKRWEKDEIRFILKKSLRTWPLPDRKDTVAFMDGPVVLVGLVDEERVLYGDVNDPKSMLTPDDDRHWIHWKAGYRTVNQERGIRFVPISEIGHEQYTMYFPIKK